MLSLFNSGLINNEFGRFIVNGVYTLQHERMLPERSVNLSIFISAEYIEIPVALV
jgi:hypothetical protein